MANSRHLKILHYGVEYWNHWLATVLDEVNLCGANLSEFFLSGVDFREANLISVNLNKAILKNALCNNAHFDDATFIGADLEGADFSRAHLEGADFTDANLAGAKFADADMRSTKLTNANLTGANLQRTTLSFAQLNGANLKGATLSHANLSYANARQTTFTSCDASRADFSHADLYRANLTGANLSRAQFIETSLNHAILTDSSIYGASVWGVDLTSARQTNLVITRRDEPTISIDNIEVAQFIYLLLNNKKIRHVIDTITSKVVLILGRFTPERKVILDAIRDELRRNNYLPILFDFEKPASRDMTETVSTLAHMARFIIADLSEAKSVSQELERVVPALPSVPVQPLLAKGHDEYDMFEHFKNYPWVLQTYIYDSTSTLSFVLKEKIIKAAEEKARNLQDRRQQ